MRIAKSPLLRCDGQLASSSRIYVVYTHKLRRRMLLSRHNALDVRKQELRVFMNELPVFKAAAVQAAPCFLDTDATIAKACKLIAEAAGNGAKLVVFPEVFVPGYPYWNWCMTPLEGSSWFRRLCLSAIEIPGPEIDVLCEAARAPASTCHWDQRAKQSQPRDDLQHQCDHFPAGRRDWAAPEAHADLRRETHLGQR